MIKRYEFEQPTRDSICDSEYEYMNESPKGDYIRYSDHVEVVKDLLEDMSRIIGLTGIYLPNKYQEKYMVMKKEYGL